MKRLNILIFLLGLSLIYSNSWAINIDTLPSKSSEPKLWFTLGGGLISGEYGQKISYVAECAFKKNVHQVSLRYSKAFDGFDAYNEFTEVGLMYGRALPAPNTHASVSIGPSIVYDFGRRGTNKPKPGLALGAQVFASTKYFGVGLYLLGNINEYESNAGLNLVIQFGEIR